MNVLDTSLRGKIFVKYDGNNIRLLQQQIRLHNTRLFDNITNGIQENLLFNFKLHNSMEVAVSLTSTSLYIYNGGWIRHEDSICNVTKILVDNEYVIVKGILSYCNTIDENNNYIEPYHFDLILRSIGSVLTKLDSEKVFFTDFRIMDN